MIDSILINVVGICLGITSIFGGTVGILVKQSKNNGRTQQQISGLFEEFRLMRVDTADIKDQCGEMNSRISKVEGYLEGMEDFRKKNGG